MRLLHVTLLYAVIVPHAACTCQEYTHRGSGYSVKGTYLAPFNSSSIKSVTPAESFLTCALICVNEVTCVALNFGGHDIVEGGVESLTPDCQILSVGDEGGDVIYRAGFYHFVMRGNITTVTLPSTTVVPMTSTESDPHAITGYTLHVNKNCYSNDLPPTHGMSVADAAACGVVCDGEPLCRGFVYSPDYKYCWIKSVCNTFTYLQDYVSYSKN